jgi:hypothetical protein
MPLAVRKSALRIAIQFTAKPTEVACIRRFPFMEDRDQFTVRIGPNPGDQVLDSRKAVRAQVVDFDQGLQPFDGMFKSVVHLGNGPVDVGPDRHLLGGLSRFAGVRPRLARLGAHRRNPEPVFWAKDLFRVKARTLGLRFGAPGKPGFGLLGCWLREVDRAFNFTYSHGCLLR